MSASAWLLKLASGGLLALVFMSQFVPTTYVSIKIFLLILGLMASAALLVKGVVSINRSTGMAILMLSAVGAMYSMYGQINNNPGAFRVLTVMVFWPIVYLLVSPLLCQRGALKTLSDVLFISLAAVVWYGYLFLGNIAGIVPDFMYFELDQGQIAAFYDGFIEYNLYSISSLLFLVPYYVHLVALRYRWGGRSSWSSILLVLLPSLLLVVLTGRRAVLLVLLSSVIVMFLGDNFFGISGDSGRKRRSVLFLYVPVIILSLLMLATMDIRLSVVWDEFLDGFDFASASSSAAERTLQFGSLMRGWIDSSILFGAGNGAATDVVRSSEFPWAYELTYVYLLFSTGVVGTLFYFSWFGWGLLRLREELRKRPDLAPLVVPMVTGVIGLCIGAASNPYFGKFDYLWIVLLPHLLAGGIRYQDKVNKF